MPVARCVICDWTGESEGFTRCPQCGDAGVPSDPANDVPVVINPHELRILTLWAERWARLIRPEAPSASKVVRGICQRLVRANPVLKDVRLSFWDEIDALEKVYPGVAVFDAAGKPLERDGL